MGLGCEYCSNTSFLQLSIMCDFKRPCCQQSLEASNFHFNQDLSFLKSSRKVPSLTEYLPPIRRGMPGQCDLFGVFFASLLASPNVSRNSNLWIHDVAAAFQTVKFQGVELAGKICQPCQWALPTRPTMPRRDNQKQKQFGSRVPCFVAMVH